jgi:GNAT superfamily N-acetyltransferase
VTSAILQSVDIVPARPGHLPWLLATFGHYAQAQTGAIERLLHGGLARAAVAVPRGYSDDLLGWAVALDESLLFGYVRAPMRRQGIGAQLVTALTQAAPVPVAYWTPSVEAIAAHGFPVRYDIHAFRALCSYSRRRDHHPTHTERAA